MWCHQCEINFSDFEDFKNHITKEHGQSFFKKSSESGESEHEISDKVNEYDVHRNISKKSSKTCNLHSNAVNESVSKKPKLPSIIKKRDPRKKKKMSPSKKVLPKHRVSAVSYQEDRSECSDSNERDHSKRLFNAESNHVNSQFVPINSIDDPEPVHNSDYVNPQPISNNNDSVFLVNPYAGQDVNNYVMGNQAAKTCNLRSNAVNESVSKKPKLPSVIKKRDPKKKKKMSPSKRVLPKRKVSAVSYQKDRSECSDSNERDHSKRLFNGESNHVNSQFVPINSIDDPEPAHNSNYVNPQPISNNNDSLFLVNPSVGQGVNNYVMGNQAVQPPVYVINPVVPNSTTSKNIKTFAFCSSNILKWLTKHKELCKNIPYPLPISLFNQVKNVHKAIFDHYCTASVSEETSAVLKVYEELDCMIHKHINSINNTLNTI